MTTLILFVVINIVAWCAIVWLAYRGDDHVVDTGALHQERPKEPLRR